MSQEERNRLIRNGRKYRIPDRVMTEVMRRDRVCVYCKLKFKALSRGSKASWEHADGNSVKHPKISNISLCCGSCNSSRRTSFAKWFASPYCRERNISRQTVAPVIQRYLSSHDTGVYW